MNWTRRDWLILLGLTLVAAVLRLYELGSVPPGFQFDEAFNAIDAKLVLAGNYPLFLPANGGREVLYTYWQAALGALLGIGVYSLRLASALAGIAAIPATYVLLRTMLRKNSRYVAAFTALALAVSFWHIHFSHYGIRVILTPVLYSAIFGLFWWGTRTDGGKKRALAYIASGMLTGLAVWTHPSGRFVPFALVLYTLWLLIRYPEKRRLSKDSPITGLMLSGITAFLVFLPLGIEFYRHPDFFFGHASEVSIFAERVSGDSPLAMLALNILKILGMFSVSGDVEWAHNLAGRPVFDPLMSIPFYIGVVIWGAWLIRSKTRQPQSDVDALALLALWVAVMLLPTLLSEAAPNYSRALPALPALFVTVGLGLTGIAGWHRPTRWFGLALALGIVAASGAIAAYDYFVVFPARPEVYYAYDADKLDALDYLSTLSDDNSVYLSELWGDEHATVYFLRGRAGVNSYDNADLLVLPREGRGAVYAFPGEQLQRAQATAALWPGAEVELVEDPYGQLLLAVVPIPAAQLADWPEQLAPEVELDAQFSEAPTLLGMRREDDGRAVWLYWQAQERMRRNLTTFVHLLDARGKRVGQVDALPGNSSYPTSDWRPGERIINRYRPEMADMCSGEQDLRLVTGWYDLAEEGRRMPRSDAPGDSALAGTLVLPSLSRPADQAQPEMPIAQPLQEHLSLWGASIQAEDLQPGSPVTLDLYWLADGGLPDLQTPISVTLADKEAVDVLWQGPLSSDARWKAGEVLCRRLRFRLPDDAPAGEYELAVKADDARQKIGDLTLSESIRLYEPPAIALPLHVTLGGEIELLGLAETPVWDENGALSLSLVWKALEPPQDSYTVFIHLVDEQGQIVAQSDAIPAGDYRTSDWLPDEIVIDRHNISVSDAEHLPPGQYRLYAGLYNANVGGERLPATDSSGQILPDARILLTTVTVTEK